MVRVHFIVEVDETDKSLTSKSLKQIADLWTASVQQLDMGKLLTVMAEDTQSHTSCGFVTAGSTSMTLPTNYGSIYQNQRKNKLSEQPTTLQGTAGLAVSNGTQEDWEDVVDPTPSYFDCGYNCDCATAMDCLRK